MDPLRGTRQNWWHKVYRRNLELTMIKRFQLFRTLIALAVRYGLKIHQVNVTTAFLNGELEEEVYMKQPPGYSSKGQDNLVC